MSIYGLLPNVVGNHALQFHNILLRLEKRFVRVFMLCDWLVVGSYGNKEIRLFVHKEVSVEVLLDYKVKTISWCWLKSRKKSFSYDLNAWWFNFLLCLGVCFG
jgi:hypothetical protein